MKANRHLFLNTLIVFLCAGLALAETISPQETVRALIQAAHNNNIQALQRSADLEKIAQGRHGRSQQDLITFLQGIKLKNTILEGGEWNANYPAASRVTMEAPLKVQFDLELRRADQKIQEDRYVVVGVHP